MSVIRIPEGYPPSNGEHTFPEWYNKHYPLREGETELERLTRLFPKQTPDESFPHWARRLASDPVLCHALTTWPHPDARVQSVSWRRDRELVVDYLAHIELEKFWKVFGYFMDKRMNAAVRMGLLPPQYLVVKGRYGVGFLEKNVAHCAMKFLGIKAAFCVDTRNQSFHFTNSVLPTKDGILGAAIEEVYRARIHPQGGAEHTAGRKIWAVQVTGSVNNRGTGVALLTHTLSKSSASPGDPNAGSKIKWQHTNTIISAQVERPGRLVIRGFISPEVLVLCGFYPMVGADQLAAAGFENGVPAELEHYPGVLRGQCEDRKHGEDSIDPRARNREVKQIYMTWEQLLPILSLFQKLEGFDISRITKP